MVWFVTGLVPKSGRGPGSASAYRGAGIRGRAVGPPGRCESPVDAWFQPDGAFVNVVGGSARVPVGDGSLQLSVWLVGRNNKGWQQLKSVQPAEIPGGPGRAPCAVSLSADEVRTIAAEFAATGK